jgi:hypothetical protein
MNSKNWKKESEIWRTKKLVRHSNSLKSRVRAIEEGRGAGALTVIQRDGSKEGFNFSRNDRLKVLLASFDLARAARNPDAQPDSSPRAIAVAKAIGKAEQISPHSALWDTVSAIVRGAEEDARDCKSHTPDPASS